ncbi:hypothetical protein quinque_015874 [Culex quinquefasciatus]
MVISGGNFKPDTLKPKEVVSLLLDDEEIELKYRQKTEERKSVVDDEKERERKRAAPSTIKIGELKKCKNETQLNADDLIFLESGAPSPAASEQSNTIMMTMIVKVQAVRIYQDHSCPTVSLGSNENAITLVEQSGADHEDLAAVVALVVLADQTPLGSHRAMHTHQRHRKQFSSFPRSKEGQVDHASKTVPETKAIGVILHE